MTGLTIVGQKMGTISTAAPDTTYWLLSQFCQTDSGYLTVYCSIEIDCPDSKVDKWWGWLKITQSIENRLSQHMLALLSRHWWIAAVRFTAHLSNTLCRKDYLQKYLKIFWRDIKNQFPSANRKGSPLIFNPIIASILKSRSELRFVINCWSSTV